jgi:hypothetical protein
VQEIPIDMPTPLPTFAQDFDLLFISPNFDDENFYVDLLTRQSQTQNFDFLTPDNSRDSFQSNQSTGTQESSLLLIGTRQAQLAIVAATAIVQQIPLAPAKKRKERSDKGQKRTIKPK